MATGLTFPTTAGRFRVVRDTTNCALCERLPIYEGRVSSRVVRGDSPRTGILIDLIYELLDAHSDTVDLTSHMSDPAWEAHADYLRALQRRGREILAVMSEPEEGYSRPVIRTLGEGAWD
jgi:hypothetical protein